MKKRMVIFLIFLLSVFAATGIFAALKEEITFEVSYGKVNFSHKKHSETYKIDCLKCHHNWKLGQTAGKLCKDCHKVKTEGKIISTKEAFHKNCKGCHDELKKTNKSTGPTGCAQCHRKK